jgi:hypothetical protein
MTKAAKILLPALIVLLLLVATIIFRLGLPILPLFILLIILLVVGYRVADKEEANRIGRNWLEDEERRTLAKLYQEQKPIGRLNLPDWEEYDLTPRDLAKELYKDEDSDSRPFLNRNRTFLLTQLKRYEDLQSQFQENFGSPMERAKYPKINSNYEKILVEFHDAIACMSKQIAQIEHLINQTEIKKEPETRGAVEWAEEASYQVAEPEPPPKWDA